MTRPSPAARTPRRALKLLASNPKGCPEMLMRVHGFSRAVIAELVQAGLATADTRTMRAGDRPVEVTTVRITDAGRVVLERRS